MWWQDWISGLTVLLTLPLIPLFMVLIGIATRAVQQRQWQTLHQLAARFADTVQGLSTLKVFGRQHRAAASIESVTERYRRETMKVLRVSFLSGFALEFLASISVAIVAVSIGFRLLDGSLALTVGPVRAAARARGVPAAAPGRRAVPRRRRGRRRDGRRVRGARCGARASARRRRAHSPGTDAPIAREGRLPRASRTSGCAAAIAPCPPSTSPPRPGTVTLIEGPSGAGKSSVLAALRGAAEFEGTRPTAVATSATSRRRPGSRGRASSRDSSPARSATTWRSAMPSPSRLVARALDLACAGDLDPTPSSACRAPGSPAARPSGSRSPGRSTATCAASPRSSRSTSRARRSTPPPRPGCGGASAPSPTTAPSSCSSRTARRAREFADDGRPARAERGGRVSSLETRGPDAAASAPPRPRRSCAARCRRGADSRSGRVRVPLRGIRGRAARGERVAHRARERAGRRCSTSRSPSSACGSSRSRARSSATPTGWRATMRRCGSSPPRAHRSCAGSSRSRRTASSRTRRGSVLGALVDDVDDLQNLPLRVVQPLVASAAVAVGAVVLVAFVWWPAALTLLACLLVAGAASRLWGWAVRVAGRARRSRRCAPGWPTPYRPPRQPRRARSRTAPRRRAGAASRAADAGAAPRGDRRAGAQAGHDRGRVAARRRSHRSPPCSSRRRASRPAR